MNDFNQLAALCHGKHIYIQTHNFPDPDAIASAFGLPWYSPNGRMGSSFLSARRIRLSMRGI